MSKNNICREGRKLGKGREKIRKNVGVGGVKYTAGERERYLVFRGGRIITAMGLYFPIGINGVTLHKA